MTPYSAKRLRWLRDALDANIVVLVDDEVVGVVVLIEHLDADTLDALAARAHTPYETALIPAREEQSRAHGFQSHESPVPEK